MDKDFDGRGSLYFEQRQNANERNRSTAYFLATSKGERKAERTGKKYMYATDRRDVRKGDEFNVWFFEKTRPANPSDER